MKSSRIALTALTLAVLGALLVADGPRGAHADDPGPAPASSAAPAPRPLAGRPLPEAASEAPAIAEWKGAEEVLLARPLPRACRAHLLREWLRVRCVDSPQSAAVVGGTSDGVLVRLQRSLPAAPTQELFVEAALPLRRGMRHMVQLAGPGRSDYTVWGQAPLLLLSAYWLDDEAAPVVTVSPLALDGDLHGMRLGSAETAVVELAPGSVAAAAGIELGDELLARDHRSLDAFHWSFAFDDGAVMQVGMMRKREPRMVELPRGRYDEKRWRRTR